MTVYKKRKILDPNVQGKLKKSDIKKAIKAAKAAREAGMLLKPKSEEAYYLGVKYQ